MGIIERYVVVCPEHGVSYSVTREPLGLGCWFWSTDDTHCKKAVEEVRLTSDQGAVDWLASDEAFEIAYRGARSCGIGKMSPAQLTAAMNALVAHLRGQ